MMMFLKQAEFKSLCTALRNNESIWNGKSMDEILSSNEMLLPDNYGYRLGEALLRNTHVTKLTLHLDHGRIDDPASVVTATNRCMSSLLQYFGACTSLREVSLTGKREANEIYVGLCLRSLARNLHIISLCVDEIPRFPSTEMAYFLNMTGSLRKLELPLMDNNEIVREALETNPTLHELILRINSFDASAMGGDILTMLVSHQSVRVLEYEHYKKGGPQLPIELKMLLQNSRTLKELRLRTYFDEPDMELLVDGLRSCTISLTHLQFLMCKFSAGATKVLLTYFQSSGGADRKILSYDLSFVNARMWGSFHFPLDPGDVMIALLADSCGVPALDLCGFDGSAIGTFWKGLGAHASEIRLPRLKIDCSDWSNHEAKAMYKAIPRLVHMRDLTLGVPRTIKDAHRFQLAVWKNGSLHHIKVYDAAKNCIDLYFVKLACERNQFLPKLLLNAAWKMPQDGHETDTMQAANWDSSSILPTLLWVAQQAPRHAPNWIFMGMLVGFKADGPLVDLNSSRKRRRRRRKRKRNKNNHCKDRGDKRHLKDPREKRDEDLDEGEDKHVSQLEAVDGWQPVTRVKHRNKVNR